MLLETYPAIIPVRDWLGSYIRESLEITLIRESKEAPNLCG